MDVGAPHEKGVADGIVALGVVANVGMRLAVLAGILVSCAVDAVDSF